MRNLTFILLLSLGAAACSGSPTPATTTPGPAATSEPKPTTSAPALSASAAKTAEDAAEPPPAPKPTGPFHWKDFAGPKVTTKITSKKAWAALPVGLDGDFGILKIALLDYVKTEGNEHVFLHGGPEQYYIPAAVTRSTEPAKGLSKGTAVMVNVAAASGFGRVTAVEKGDEGLVVKFKYWWVSGSEGELPDTEVIKLENKVSFGAPVAYKEEGNWRTGQLMHADKDNAWIISGSGHPVQSPLKDVKPMKVTQAFKKGDKVWAYSLQLKPAKVLEVIDEGVAYKVKFDEGGQEETLGLDKVTSPL